MNHESGSREPSDVPQVSGQNPAESDGRTTEATALESPREQSRHALPSNPSIIVEEVSGVAAAESVGVTVVDNDLPPERTAGSG